MIRDKIHHIETWKELESGLYFDALHGKVVGVTGHRPQKLGGFNPVTNLRLSKLCSNLLSKIRPKLVNNGMALGFDQAVIHRCIRNSIPFKAFIPCVGQESRWPDENKHLYDYYMAKAIAVDCASPKYTRTCLKERDVRLADESEVIVSLWDGNAEEGGTTHTVFVALKQGKDVINLWKLWEKT